MAQSNGVLEDVRDYYGKVLSGTSDLRTAACCTDEAYPRYIKDIIESIDDSVSRKILWLWLSHSQRP